MVHATESLAYNPLRFPDLRGRKEVEGLSASPLAQPQSVVSAARQALPEEPAIIGGAPAIIIVRIAHRAIPAVVVTHSMSGSVLLPVLWIVVLIALVLIALAVPMPVRSAIEA